MVFASRLVRDLIVLAEDYALHTGRSVASLSNFSVGRAGLFTQLRAGGDCTTATAEAALDWFTTHWPLDLRWPVTVARPSKSPGDASLMVEGFSAQVAPEEAQFLVEISHAPVWPSGRRPPWWSNLEIREFLTRAHRQQTLSDAKSEGNARFGRAFPSISAIQRFWAKLDEIKRAAAVRQIPPKSKKEAA